MDIRNAILSLANQPRQREPITLAGQELFIVEMDAKERDAYEASQVVANAVGTGMENFRAKLLVRCIVDADGKRVFADADVDAVGALPAPVLRKAFHIAHRLNPSHYDDDLKAFEKKS